MAIAAVDLALWDLKARLLGAPARASSCGMAHDLVPIYGIGRLHAPTRSRGSQEQLARWVELGIPAREDEGRIARRATIPSGSGPPAHAVGPNAALFVDANGAYERKQALELAARFRDESDVSWFEEPVSSDDLDGLRLIRERGAGGMAIAAGEYGYDLPYFERMLDVGGVDILQADVTRCAGITELLRVDALCRARSTPLSLHCGPAIHLHAALALEQLVHLEYFHDHVRIEHLLFDGVTEPHEGALAPDLTRPGNGLEFKRADAERHAA